MLCICCKISSGKSIRSLYVSTFLTFCIKVSGWIKYIWLLLSFDVHYFVDVYAYQCTWFAWIGAQCRISRQMIYGQLMMGSRNRGRSRKRCMYKDGCTVVLQYYSTTVVLQNSASGSGNSFQETTKRVFFPISQEKYQNTYIK